MNATVRFYLGFALALALVIAASYDVGYHAGEAHPRTSAHGLRSP